MNTRHKPELKVMPDYCCWPLWISDPPDYDNVDPHDMNLPASLCERLIAWSDQFDDMINEDDPGHSDFESPEAEAQFVALGLQLAQEVKQHVQDKYQVLYFNLRGGGFTEILLEEV